MIIVGPMGTKEEIANLVQDIRNSHPQIRKMAPLGPVTFKM